MDVDCGISRGGMGAKGILRKKMGEKDVYILEESGIPILYVILS